MSQPTFPVTVLGAGLCGAATALELARHGVPVVLIDQDERPLNRASLRNEGKIHLGLIYANDRSRRTALLQLRGALRFRQLLARWIGAAADQLSRSTPFFYMVAHDSVLSLDELAQHYSFVQRSCEEWLTCDSDLDYLGTTPNRLYQTCELSELRGVLRVQAFEGGFRTAEVAIDTAELADRVRTAVLSSPLIRFLPRHRITSVDRGPEGFSVRGDNAGGRWRVDTEQVVNALWENRLAIDHTAGLVSQPGWLHRLKYRVIAQLPERLRGGPSVTVVLGRYGDVVVRPDGTAYLSWYPAGLQGWTHELTPPESWSGPCRGEAPAAAARAIARDILQAIDDWYPGIGASEPLLVDAGAIVAWGRTDVDDAASALHDRTHVGVTSVDGYHSVDPGKLTTAPLFAQAAAARVLGVPQPV